MRILLVYFLPNRKIMLPVFDQSQITTFSFNIQLKSNHSQSQAFSHQFCPLLQLYSFSYCIYPANLNKNFTPFITPSIPYSIIPLLYSQKHSSYNFLLNSQRHLHFNSQSYSQLYSQSHSLWHFLFNSLHNSKNKFLLHSQP